MSDCNICGKDMSLSSHPLDEDCGGDCLECMALEGGDPDCLLKMVEVLKSENQELRRKGDLACLSWNSEIERLEKENQELREKLKEWDDIYIAHLKTLSSIRKERDGLLSLTTKNRDLKAFIKEACEVIKFYGDKDNCDTIQGYGKIFYYDDTYNIDIGLKKPILCVGKRARQFMNTDKYKEIINE